MAQARTEWVQITRQIENDVRQAEQDYRIASKKANRLRDTVLPRAHSIREKTKLLMQAGETDVLTFLQAQRDYVEVVRQYRDALVNERRAYLITDDPRYGTVYGMEKTTVYLTDAQKRALERAARLSGRSEAELIREGVEVVTGRHQVAEPVLPLFESGQPDLATAPA